MLNQKLFFDHFRRILRYTIISAFFILFITYLTNPEYYEPKRDIYSINIRKIATGHYYNMNIDTIYSCVSSTNKGGYFYLTEAWDHNQRIYVALQIDPPEVEAAEALFRSCQYGEKNRKALKGPCYVYDLNNYEGTAEHFQEFCDEQGIPSTSIKCIGIQYIPFFPRFLRDSKAGLSFVIPIALVLFLVITGTILSDNKKSRIKSFLRFYLRRDLVIEDLDNGVPIGSTILGAEYLAHTRYSICFAIPYQYIRSVTLEAGELSIITNRPLQYIVTINEHNNMKWTISIRKQKTATELHNEIHRRVDQWNAYHAVAPQEDAS